MSPHRTFLDDLARLWNAWDVIPAWGERRTGDRRTRSAAGGTHIIERRTRERRRQRGLRISLPPRLAQGWIAFEHGDERRRVAPIVAGWEILPEEGLRDLWREAERLPPRRKRLVE
ncbi:MAG TPA: hypothetical protein VFN38_14555 [Gemmatimonadaceae bacterium]|nr:hypothetical protein [Gemmatimonadaceae bacterium]